MGKREKRITVIAFVQTPFGDKPLKNATVRVKKFEWFSWVQVASGRTDYAGRIVFTVKCALYMVGVTAEKWESSYDNRPVSRTTKQTTPIPVVPTINCVFYFQEDDVSYAPPAQAPTLPTPAPPTPTPAPSPSPPTPTPTPAPAQPKYIANKNTMEAHLASCIWVKKMLERNKVPYNDLDKAHADGYDNCHYCIGDSKR